jgi:hypothetical protein
MWSDPVNTPGLRPNDARGCGTVYGPDATQVWQTILTTLREAHISANKHAAALCAGGFLTGQAGPIQSKRGATIRTSISCSRPRHALPPSCPCTKCGAVGLLLLLDRTQCCWPAAAVGQNAVLLVCCCCWTKRGAVGLQLLLDKSRCCWPAAAVLPW